MWSNGAHRVISGQLHSGHAYLSGFPSHLFAQTREIWGRRDGIKGNFWVPVQLLSSSLTSIDKCALQTDSNTKVLQVLTCTSPSSTLIALTYFSTAGSCWPRGSPSSWCQLWASLAGTPTASHRALGFSLHRPKFDVFDIYILILCISRTTIMFTPLFAPAGNPLCTHALLSPVKHNSH